jgi:putative flavoprotein involved in K+ transport
VLLATGGFNLPKLPGAAADLPLNVDSVSALDYKRPDQLSLGGVLVVGASATGIQIADEIHRSGRPVTISVGEHVRLPRTYRGRDIQWWMDRIGRLDERYDEVDDIVRARHTPSPQLVGTPDRSTLDLNALTARGVRLVGRLAAVSDATAHFSGSLRNVCSLADLKMLRLLDQIDEWSADRGIDDDVGPPERFADTVVDEDPVLSIGLSTGDIRTVIWATGYRPDYSWLDIPVLDRKGEIRHDGGVVVDSPGLYRIGLNFLRRRKSSFIHGAEDDAIDLTEHLAAYLGSEVGSRRAAG